MRMECGMWRPINNSQSPMISDESGAQGATNSAGHFALGKDANRDEITLRLTIRTNGVCDASHPVATLRSGNRGQSPLYPER